MNVSTYQSQRESRRGDGGVFGQIIGDLAALKSTDGHSAPGACARDALGDHRWTSTLHGRLHFS